MSKISAAGDGDDPSVTPDGTGIIGCRREFDIGAVFVWQVRAIVDANGWIVSATCLFPDALDGRSVVGVISVDRSS